MILSCWCFLFPAFPLRADFFGFKRCDVNNICLSDRTNIKGTILLCGGDLKMGVEAALHFGSKHSSPVDISVIALCLPTIPCSNCAGSGLSHRFIRVETG